MDLNVVADPKSGGVSGNDTAHIYVLSGKLGIIGSDDNKTELSETDKVKMGGYVPLNNDNDDYRFNGNTPVVDSDETDATPGENDMIGLTLHAIVPKEVGGTYRLRWDSGIKLWRTKDKSPLNTTPPTPALVDANTEFDATVDTSLYVEGVTDSTTARDAHVHLDWLSPPQKDAQGNVLLGPDGKPVRTLAEDLDVAPFTVYKVNGPTNVPGYARYSYMATVPGLTTPGTWAAEGGSVSSTTGNTAQILWGAGGGDVSFADFSPNVRFMCKRDVNVVQVELDLVASQAQNLGNVSQENIGYATGTYIASNIKGAAMSAKVTVKEIKGVLVNGVYRGEKYIRLGFIQNIDVEKNRGVFNKFTPPQDYVSDLEAV